MARYGITYEEVKEAAERMLQQGKNPTMEGIRMALGAGSFTTINKYLHSWRAHKLVATNKEAPEKIISVNEVSHAVNSVWEQLNQQAQQQIDKIKQGSEEKINQLLNEKTQLEQIHHEVEEALAQAKAQINYLRADITLLKKELSEEHKQRLIAVEKANHAENTLAKIETETTQHRAELRQTYNDAVEKLQACYDDDLHRLKTLIENQRTDFMLKLDNLIVAKEKLEKTQTKMETELSQQITRAKEFEEHARRIEFDLQIAQHHQQDYEREVIALKAEVKQKDNAMNELNEAVKLGQQKFEAAIELIGRLKSQLENQAIKID